jgi:hypothetical protein
MRFTTWKELLKEEMKRQGESGKPLEGCNQSDDRMRGAFGNHWEKPDGEFIAWTETRNYFNVKKNGLTIVKSESRISDEVY